MVGVFSWMPPFFMTHEKWVVHQRSSENGLFFYSIGKSLGIIVHNRTYPNSQPQNEIGVFFRCNSLKGSKRAQPSAVLPCIRFLLRIYGPVFLEVEREVLEANNFMKSGSHFFGACRISFRLWEPLINPMSFLLKSTHLTGSWGGFDVPFSGSCSMPGNHLT